MICTWCGVAPATETNGECASCSRLPGHEFATAWRLNETVMEWVTSVADTTRLVWGGYCAACDNSYTEEVALRVGEFWQVWACPHCGNSGTCALEIADAWWPVQQYLLQSSDADEEYGLTLPLSPATSAYTRTRVRGIL